MHSSGLCYGLNKKRSVSQGANTTSAGEFFFPFFLLLCANRNNGFLQKKTGMFINFSPCSFKKKKALGKILIKTSNFIYLVGFQCLHFLWLHSNA